MIQSSFCIITVAYGLLISMILYMTNLIQYTKISIVVLCTAYIIDTTMFILNKPSFIKLLNDKLIEKIVYKT